MPAKLMSDQLTRALENVAMSTVSSRHPGPRRDQQEPLEQLAAQGHSRSANMTVTPPGGPERTGYYTVGYTIPKKNSDP